MRPTSMPAIATRTLRAMNSDVSLMCCLPDASRRLARAERWLAAYEERFSRFRLLSELTRLNGSAGRPFQASPTLFRLVQLSLDFARCSGGLFDPTILPQLEAAGYDLSFELVGSRPGRAFASHPTLTCFRDVHLDQEARRITLPAGGGIDLGGMAKGWAVDRIAAILGTPCLVNGGGDVFASSGPANKAAWRVGVEDPFRPENDLMVLALQDRGVATSSLLKRRWQLGDAVFHHIIDPRTGRPSASDAVQVTAVAASALLADFHAKVALMLGVDEGIAYLHSEPEVEGLFVRQDGALFASLGLEMYIEKAD